MRYHTHIVKPGEVETYHDQVGYWLWEPATACSNPFLEHAFKTVEVTINPDGTWSYDEDTVLMIRGKTEPFHHTDRNVLTKVAEPTPQSAREDLTARIVRDGVRCCRARSDS